MSRSSTSTDFDEYALQQIKQELEEEAHSPTTESILESSFQSTCSNWSQSWNGSVNSSLHSLTNSFAATSFSDYPQRRMRPLSLANSYSGGFNFPNPESIIQTGSITRCNSLDTHNRSTNRLKPKSSQDICNVLSSTNIQGLTGEHIAKLLAPMTNNNVMNNVYSNPNGKNACQLNNSLPSNLVPSFVDTFIQKNNLPKNKTQCSQWPI